MQRVNIEAPAFRDDPARPDGYGGGSLQLGPLIAADQLGATVYELPPGQAICPYHYEHAEEEWLLVLVGNPTLRDRQGGGAPAPWDVVCFAPGPGGAHKLTNETDSTI